MKMCNTESAATLSIYPIYGILKQLSLMMALKV